VTYEKMFWFLAAPFFIVLSFIACLVVGTICGTFIGVELWYKEVLDNLGCNKGNDVLFSYAMLGKLFWVLFL
jgi:hypothetical protein